MSKTLIVYFSKYGTTKKYAEWIAKELNGDSCSINDFRETILNDYDTIIIGSGLYAGKVKGVDILIKNYEAVKNKSWQYLRMDWQIIVKSKSGINYNRLNLKHKIMMGLLKKMVTKKELHKVKEEDKMFIETYGKTVYFMDKNSIRELVEYCQKLPVPSESVLESPDNCRQARLA